MRLLSVKIEEYKNLKNFEIDFSEDRKMFALIGKNGSGKSNFFEALVTIFRNVDLNESQHFYFELEYMLNDLLVQISSKPSDRGTKAVMTVAGKRVSQLDQPSYLPRRIFLYYSGQNERIEHVFSKHHERHYIEMLDGKSPERRFILTRSEYFSFVSLAFLAFQDKKLSRFMEDRLGIQNFDSALFTFHEPDWRHNKRPLDFWGARGKVRDFLDRLYPLALAPIDSGIRIQKTEWKGGMRQVLYLYLPSIDKLHSLAKHYKSYQEFFTVLESGYASEMIDDISIRVEKKSTGPDLEYRNLSEGERQLITVLGMLIFTRDEESLILLDEPETYLDPNWQWKFIDILNEAVEIHDTSQIFIATHEPLLIGSMEYEEVKVFVLDDESGKITVEPPLENPKGLGVAGILTHIFGIPSSVDPETASLMQDQRDLQAKKILGKKLSAKEEKYWVKLDSILSERGFLWENRDSLYEDFLRAYYKKMNALSAAKTPISIKNREAVIQEIIDSLSIEYEEPS